MFQRNAAVCNSHESNAQKIGTRSECIEESPFALHYTLEQNDVEEYLTLPSNYVGLIEEQNLMLIICSFKLLNNDENY